MRTAKEELYRQALVKLVAELVNTSKDLKLIAGSLVTVAGRLETAAENTHRFLEDEG